MNEFVTLRQQAGLTVTDIADRLGYTERQVYRWENGDAEPRRAILELLKSFNDVDIPSNENSTFTFIDLFAGIGGLRRGFEKIGGKCIYTCEWDRYSQQTYRANYPHDKHDIVGDIREVKIDEIPEFDVLLAGFPCQPFSIAGVSKKNALNRPHGFACEAQGTLFFEIAKIIKRHQPKAFLLENVKNLVNHDQGRTFRVIREVLSDQLGYHIDWKVLNAKSWTPQHRERIFIAGFKEKNKFNFENMKVPDPLKGPKLKTILHAYDNSDDIEKIYSENGKALKKYTLSEHLWRYLRDYAEKHKKLGNGFGFGLFGPDDVARTLSARYYKDGSEILIRQEKRAPRRLTPRECARLMGFDEPQGSKFKIPVSDTQAYKQFGNAVVVPVIEAVAHHMKADIIASVLKEKKPKKRMNSR